MIATFAIIALIVILAVAIAVVIHQFFDDKYELDYYTPKYEMEDNREELKKLDEKIKEIKSEKSDNANDSSNHLNLLDI